MSDERATQGNGKAVAIMGVQKDIEFIRATVTEIKAELGALRDWRNQTDARLAEGAEKLAQLEARPPEHAHPEYEQGLRWATARDVVGYGLGLLGMLLGSKTP